MQRQISRAGMFGRERENIPRERRSEAGTSVRGGDRCYECKFEPRVYTAVTVSEQQIADRSLDRRKPKLVGRFLRPPERVIVAGSKSNAAELARRGRCGS